MRMRPSLALQVHRDAIHDIVARHDRSFVERGIVGTFHNFSTKYPALCVTEF